ncbi:hypothetical protein Bhyg_16393 [Pseudolycoriella hygida]|uniref:Spermatogenesis-associated protein 6 N-terminal domain-containing protein n=1 Tax=Pseudolycoriella hygida TaxID=35572 RepID=A0A9Q0RUL1_9DIPT|nr:hypothetical protein Bhyg_16393 [Pseudolycoriella hygida]
MSKSMNIKIELQIHAITCPGVWLCQKSGDVELSIATLGYTFAGRPLKPRFPLCYHEKFSMDGYFSGVTSVLELEKALDEEQISFTLWQKGRRLAYHVNKIGVILNYTGCLNGKFAITDNAIIMSRASCFPGTISPKIEYTASIKFMTECMRCSRGMPRESFRERRNIANLCEKRNISNEKNVMRQNPVCHTHAKQKHRWRRNKDVDNRCEEMCNENNDHRNTNNGSELQTTVQQSEFFGSIHSEKECCICLKYSSIFDSQKEEE